MLTAAEITAMKTTLDASLPDSAQVSRKALTSDGAGGFTEVWTSAAAVACRIAASGQTPQEKAIAARLGATSVWTLTFPASTDVKVADRVIVGSRTFEVAGVLAHSWEIGRRVVCVEVL